MRLRRTGARPSDADRFCDEAFGPAVDGREEFDHACDVLVLPGTQPVRQIEHELAALRQGKRRPAPENAAVVGRQHAGDRFQQRRLAGAVGSDQTEHLAGIHRKGNVGERALFAVALGEAGDLHQRRRAIGSTVKGMALDTVMPAPSFCGQKR